MYQKTLRHHLWRHRKNKKTGAIRRAVILSSGRNAARNSPVVASDIGDSPEAFGNEGFRRLLKNSLQWVASAGKPEPGQPVRNNTAEALDTHIDCERRHRTKHALTADPDSAPIIRIRIFMIASNLYLGSRKKKFIVSFLVRSHSRLSHRLPGQKKFTTVLAKRVRLLFRKTL